MIHRVPNPISYYPLETAESFCRRLCSANHMDPDTVRRALVHGQWTVSAAERQTAKVSRLEAMAGVAPGTIARSDDSTSVTQR